MNFRDGTLAVITALVAAALGLASNLVANRMEPHIKDKRRLLFVSFFALLGASLVLGVASIQNETVSSGDQPGSSGSQSQSSNNNSNNIQIQSPSGSVNINGFLPGQQKKAGAAISIAQFTLNKEASPYFNSCSGKVKGKEVDIYWFNEVGATLTRYLEDLSPEAKLSLMKLDKLPEEVASLPARIKQDQVSYDAKKTDSRRRDTYSWPEERISRWRKDLSELPTSIRHVLEGDRIVDRASILTGLAPVFDVTFLNEGGEALVLTGVTAVLVDWLGGGDTSGGIAIPPLAVSYRYHIQKLIIETPLVPPIKIPSDEALRIQVQIYHDNRRGGHFQTGSLLRLQFNLGGKATVSTKDFYLSGYDSTRNLIYATGCDGD